MCGLRWQPQPALKCIGILGVPKHFRWSNAPHSSEQTESAARSKSPSEKKEASMPKQDTNYNDSVGKSVDIYEKRTGPLPDRNQVCIPGTDLWAYAPAYCEEFAYAG